MKCYWLIIVNKSIQQLSVIKCYDDLHCLLSNANIEKLSVGHINSLSGLGCILANLVLDHSVILLFKHQ